MLSDFSREEVATTSRGFYIFLVREFYIRREALYLVIKRGSLCKEPLNIIMNTKFII